MERVISAQNPTKDAENVIKWGTLRLYAKLKYPKTLWQWHRERQTPIRIFYWEL